MPKELVSSEPDISEIKPYSVTPKRVKKTFNISKNKKRHNYPPVPPGYKQSYNRYETESDQDVYYDKSKPKYIDESSELESDVIEYKYHRPSLPPKANKYEIVSSIPIPVISKTAVEYFHREIEAIVASKTKNKKKMISNVMLSLNKCLLLSIDSYVNLSVKDEIRDDINMSFESQLSNQISNRISNFYPTATKWRERYPEIILSSSNLLKVLKLAKVYCENTYVKYIITSNVIVAYTIINEEDRALKLIKSLDSILQNSSLYQTTPVGFTMSNDGFGKNVIRSSTGSQSHAYQGLLQAIKYFNAGILQLRQFKSESVLNQGYYQVENEDMELRERCQKYFYKTIETLNSQMANRRSLYSETKQRYHSGDFRITHKSNKSASNDT